MDFNDQHDAVVVFAINILNIAGKLIEWKGELRFKSPLIYYYLGHSWVLGLPNYHDASLQNIFTQTELLVGQQRTWFGD